MIGENGNGTSSRGIFSGYLNRLFNIAGFEWSRVFKCWSITFFFKVGSAIGWTVLTAAFVARFGIAFLPTLFVLNAMLIIASTLFFERMITRMKREVLMVLMLLVAAICLFFAAILYDRNPYAFFALVIFAESVFLAQFNVFIPIYVGDHFTPLQSQRTFPFVESGETIGSMLGGVVIGIFASQLPFSWFLYLWIAMLVLAMLVFAVTAIRRGITPPLPFRASFHEHQNIKDQMKVVFRGIRKYPFLKGLVVIVLLQWVFMNVLELQYTKAMEQNVTNHREPTVAYHIDPAMFRSAVMSSDEGVAVLDDLSYQPRVLSSHEQSELTGKLGMWKGIFHGGALLVQVLFASRFITSLGIVGSMLLHPILMLMSLVGMFLKFGFVSAVITRFNYETSYAIFKNSYLASHYAFPRFLRDQAAEFLEGMVRPMGTIIGMLLISGMQIFFLGRDLSMGIHLLLAGLMIAVLVALFRLQPKYTEISREQLFSDLPYPDKLNAIEILAQRGHENTSMILLRKLFTAETESLHVRRKLLQELGRLKDEQALPHILEQLSAKEPEVRLEAAYALMNFSDIGDKFFTQTFSRYRMVETLKEVFRTESSSSVRGAIIRLFSMLREPQTVPFLLDVLQNGSSEARADCIYTLGLFRDPNAVHYILPFVGDQDARIRASAAIALWQFPMYQDRALTMVRTMVENPELHIRKAGIFAAGEINGTFRETLRIFFRDENSEIRLEAAFALAKCADPEGFEHVFEHFLSAPPSECDDFGRFLNRLPEKVSHALAPMLNQLVSLHLHDLLRAHGDKDVSELQPEILERLRRLYILLDEHEELARLESAVAKNHSYVS